MNDRCFICAKCPHDTERELNPQKDPIYISTCDCEDDTLFYTSSSSVHLDCFADKVERWTKKEEADEARDSSKAQ